MLKDGICSFENYGGETTKNVQGVRKIALKTLNMCLDEHSLFGRLAGVCFG